MTPRQARRRAKQTPTGAGWPCRPGAASLTWSGSKPEDSGTSKAKSRRVRGGHFWAGMGPRSCFRPEPGSTANEKRRPEGRRSFSLARSTQPIGCGAVLAPLGRRGVRLPRVMSAAQFFSFGAGRVSVSTVANATRVVGEPQPILVPSERNMHVLYGAVINRIAARPTLQVPIDAGWVAPDVDRASAGMHGGMAGSGDACSRAE